MQFLFPMNNSLWILQAGQMSRVHYHHSKYVEDDGHLSFSIVTRGLSKTVGLETTSSSVDYGIYSTRYF